MTAAFIVFGALIFVSLVIHFAQMADMERHNDRIMDWMDRERCRNGDHDWIGFNNEWICRSCKTTRNDHP